MCGIVGYTGAQEAAPLLLDGLKKLEYRGYDSAGIAVENSGVIRMIKASGQISNLAEKTRGGAELPGCSGIGHTRWATHGAPTDVNAHPHMSNDGKFAVVHNGIIENYTELRQELRDKGFVFRSETDTEVIVHLLDMYYTGDLKTAVMRTAARLEGSYALGVLCADEPGKLCAIKMASPLILGVGIGENFFASDVTALVSHTKNVIYLEDGEFAELTPDSISIYDCTGRPVTHSVSRVVWDVEAAEKGGYDHFMLKEIMEQPRALKSTIEPRVKDGRIVLDDFDQAFREYFAGVKKIIITACGSAYHAGCVGRTVLEALCRIDVRVEVASELRYSDPIVDENTLLIAISQSGETADTIAAVKECQSRGARVLAIVNVVGSTVAKLADHVLYTWAGPEIAVATTKGYTTQVAVLQMLAVWAANERGLLSAERYEALVNGIHNASLFYIGRSMDYAVCLEASLKLKEISYIHSEAYAAGELKHGTIALIDPGRLVIALACHEALLEKTMSNIKEVKARGAKVMAVVNEGSRKVFAEADDALFVPVTDPLLAAIPEIVPLQLFAYHVAKANGCDIDKPRNLAKSVTVE